MEHELKTLGYQLSALEPLISANTLSYHYGKHLKTYITNLNGLIAKTEYQDLALEEIVKRSSGAIFNNAAQVFNHEFYFEQFCPAGENECKMSADALKQSELGRMVERDFGTIENFKDEFSKAALSLFGSGWVWLCANDESKLVIVSLSNAGCPLTMGLKPFLVIDVWEHAYYLDYQNRRGDYISAFWNILDWGVIARRLK